MDWRLRLKWFVRKYDKWECTGLIWLRTGIVAPYGHGNDYLGSIKCGELFD